MTTDDLTPLAQKLIKRLTTFRDAYSHRHYSLDRADIDAVIAICTAMMGFEARREAMRKVLMGAKEET